MKKLFTSLLALLLAATASAQLGDGFYRVQNYATTRYIQVVDNHSSGANLTTGNVDVSALYTYKPFENIVDDPATIFYAKNASGGYTLEAQGTSSLEITSYPLKLLKEGNYYYAYASAKGLTKYLRESYAGTADEGRMTTEANRNSSTLTRWYIQPYSLDDGRYFGLKPTLHANGKFYRTFYASFAYTFASSGMKAFYVNKIDKKNAVVVYSEISGQVAPGTPVIIECSSSESANNKFNLFHDGGTSPAGNKLTGVYFCNELKKNYVVNDPATMRVLGLTSTGKLGFVKSTETYIARNTAYLKVSADTPAELVLMTQADYDANITAEPIVVTANSYTITYGQALPASFGYTTTDEITGTPVLTCDATADSPAGEYPIVITRGTVQEPEATFVNGTLTIKKATLTAKVGNYSRDEFTPNPTFAVTVTGYVKGEDQSVLTTYPVATSEATQESPAGQYPITVSGGEAQNYAFNYVSGTLTVTAGPLVTITAQAAEITYGDALPTFTYTVEGGTLHGTPEIHCTANADSPAGYYDIVVSRGTVANGNLKLVNAKLRIKKATLTATANNVTRVEGQPNPEFTITYTGFVKGQNESHLTDKPYAWCNNVGKNAYPGEYTIYVSEGYNDVNYTFNRVNGVLTVTEAPTITITARSYTIEYGDELPTFEYDVEGGTFEGEPALACSATSASPVGNYTINVGVGTVDYLERRLKRVPGRLTITRAPLTVKADDKTRVEGEENPELTVTYTGFRNGDTDEVLYQKPYVKTDATRNSLAGEYPITVSGGACNNYALSYEDGTLTVTPQPTVTITARSYSRSYGEANPVLEYDVEGGELDGTPALACAATEASHVGEYPITVSKGTLKNFHVVYVNGQLDVTKAPLTVKADDCGSIQGEPLPAFSLTYDGFRNGDTEAALTVKPVATTTATTESPAGQYPITVSGGEAQDYEFTYVNGTLTISDPQYLIVTVKNASREYGLENPQFEYTVTGAGQLEGEPVITCEATPASSVGKYVISASRGTITNTYVTFIAGELTVGKAPLTASVGNYTRSELEDNPVFEIQYDGFRNGDDYTALSAQPVLTTTGTPGCAPGVYDLVLSGGAALNYALAYQNGTLTVTEAPTITIRVQDAEREYGEENPAFSYTVEGGELTGEPAIACVATKASPAGAYDITVAAGTLSYPRLQFVKGTLTVTKAMLTVSVGDYTRDDTEQNPVFELLYEGFKNGEDESVLTVKPTATTVAVAGSPAGEYDIVISGGEAQNYDFTYVNGHLTVTGIALTTADADAELEVYSLTGVRMQVKSLHDLHRGIYIVNGRKVIVK